MQFESTWIWIVTTLIDLLCALNVTTSTILPLVLPTISESVHLGNGQIILRWGCGEPVGKICISETVGCLKGCTAFVLCRHTFVSLWSRKIMLNTAICGVIEVFDLRHTLTFLREKFGKTMKMGSSKTTKISMACWTWIGFNHTNTVHTRWDVFTWSIWIYLVLYASKTDMLCSLVLSQDQVNLSWPLTAT